MNTFQVGQFVRLNSGGALMQVISVKPMRGFVRCAWSGGINKTYTDDFDYRVLTKVEE
jgi:uncharacterized protein YodC (DUF2158 family)